jgi:7-carboxy-7-deazaguanine synthase
LGKVITIETAGTFFHDLSCDLMSISPKLAHSTPLSDPRWAVIHERERWKPKIVRKLMDTYIYQLKFVVSGTNDMHEIELLLSELGHVDPERVLIMPEGRSAKKIWRTARAILPEVMKRGWRLTPRIQIDLFGDIRGT